MKKPLITKTKQNKIKQKNNKKELSSNKRINLAKNTKTSN